MRKALKKLQFFSACRVVASESPLDVGFNASDYRLF